MRCFYREIADLLSRLNFQHKLLMAEIHDKRGIFSAKYVYFRAPKTTWEWDAHSVVNYKDFRHFRELKFLKIGTKRLEFGQIFFSQNVIE